MVPLSKYLTWTKNVLFFVDYFEKSGTLRCVFFMGTGRKITLGLYSLSSKTSHRQISWSLEAARLMLQLSYRSEIWQAHRQQRCQISERLEKFKPESRGFETSRDIAVRLFTA